MFAAMQRGSRRPLLSSIMTEKSKTPWRFKFLSSPFERMGWNEMDMTTMRSAAPVNAWRDLNFDDAHELVRQDDGGKWDVTVERRDLTWCEGQLAWPGENGEQRLSPSAWATGQLCTRLGIPTPYFRKCPSQLQEAQAHHWLCHGPHKPGEKWLLRAKEAQLRGVLSERYSPPDNAMLLDEVRLLLPGRYCVDWLGLSEENLHLRIVDPARCWEVLPDDGLMAGTHLSNSEVGFRSVTVDALVFRLVCSNGLVRLVNGKSLLRQRHLHVSESRFAGALAVAIDQALKESERFLEQMQVATRTPVPEITEVMATIAEKWHLGEETTEAAQKALLHEAPAQQESLYGLVNAYTAAAQRLPDEKRYGLEVLAGHLAQHGVSAYTPKRSKSQLPELRRRELAPNLEGGNSSPSDSEGTDATGFDVTEFDVVEAAQEMFEAEIVARQPLLASRAEVDV